MHAWLYGCVLCACRCPQVPEEGIDSLELESQWLGAAMWALGTEPRFSAAASALDC